MANSEFDRRFEELTGNAPLEWQRRLYHECFATGRLPPVIDLPTGLGKTMVIVIWLVARELHPDRVPTRLIYVVDRRTVVDQATDLAFQVVKNWRGQKGGRGKPPAISTLRGQLADNRQWSTDLSRPAIIIGTVDLIGSALLFSGYRSSSKRRPLEAGLLGQDSLLVLDEAHLSKPFEKLIRAITAFQHGNDKPMRVIRMSATGGDSEAQSFQLVAADFSDPIISQRYSAKKRLSVTTLPGKGDLNKTLATTAIQLAQEPTVTGRRIVVFVRRPDDARKIAATIRSHASTKTRLGPYADSVDVLTGTMRGLERDQLVEQSVFKQRWLNGNLKPDDKVNQSPVFLVSTSAGEVGFDLNADHLVGDAAPLDSWIQRLGRVNRRGNGDAAVVLVVPSEAAESKTAEKSDFNRACIATSKLLTDGMDVSPQALAELKESLLPEQLQSASAPDPATVELTDILLDSWSMTSITRPMPGRPEVAPWLRGIASDLPQTTIAWRAELDLLKDHSDSEKLLRAIFAKHPIRPHESVTVNSYQAVDFFKQVKRKRPDLLDTQVVVKRSRDMVICRVQDIIAKDSLLDADPMLILPATFGGLENGMLSHEAIPPAPKPDDPPLPSLDVADHEGYEQTVEARPRLRIVIERNDDGWCTAPLPGGREIPADLDLKPLYAERTQLYGDLRSQNFRRTLVLPIKLDDDGDEVQSLVFLSPAVQQNEPVNQTLSEHVGAVETEVMRIAESVKLPEPIRLALCFAAKWHDEGKKADVWQRFIGRVDEHSDFLGKGKSPRDPKSLKGYRHEFGSLLRIQFPDRCETGDCLPPTDSGAYELALHLIATHHGMGRPHFDHAVYDQFTDDERDRVRADSIRRFARLQKKYGHWYLAWLENLLRCADAIASVKAGSTSDEDETEDQA